MMGLCTAAQSLSMQAGSQYLSIRVYYTHIDDVTTLIGCIIVKKNDIQQIVRELNLERELHVCVCLAK